MSLSPVMTHSRFLTILSFFSLRILGVGGRREVVLRGSRFLEKKGEERREGRRGQINCTGQCLLSAYVPVNCLLSLNFISTILCSALMLGLRPETTFPLCQLLPLCLQQGTLGRDWKDRQGWINKLLSSFVSVPVSHPQKLFTWAATVHSSFQSVCLFVSPTLSG